MSREDLMGKSSWRSTVPATKGYHRPGYGHRHILVALAEGFVGVRVHQDRDSVNATLAQQPFWVFREKPVNVLPRFYIFQCQGRYSRIHEACTHHLGNAFCISDPSEQLVAAALLKAEGEVIAFRVCFRGISMSRPLV